MGSAVSVLLSPFDTVHCTWGEGASIVWSFFSMRAGSRVAVPFVSHRDDQMSRIFSCLDVGTASSFAARLTRHPLHVDGTSWDDVPGRGEGKMRNNITIKSRIKTSQFQGQAMEFDVPFHILPSLFFFFSIYHYASYSKRESVSCPILSPWTENGRISTAHIWPRCACARMHTAGDDKNARINQPVHPSSSKRGSSHRM